MRGVSSEHLEDPGMLRAAAVCSPFCGECCKLGVFLGLGRASLGLGRAERGRASGNTSTGKGNNLLKVIPGPVAEPGIKSRCAELVLRSYSRMWLH